MEYQLSVALDKLEQWKRDEPSPTPQNFVNDMKLLGRWSAEGQKQLIWLPPPSKRSEQYRQVAYKYRDILAEVRSQFVAIHGEKLYASLTNDLTELVRVEELIYRMADRYPGLAPTKADIRDDEALQLKDKQGYELSQGLILAELLANPIVGRHLMYAMRQPRTDSLGYLMGFQKNGELNLGNLKLVRKNKIGYLTLSNIECLNAEDDELNVAMEIAVDLILLDPDIEIGVMRGDVMEHNKYQGRRVFCSGINLTKLYAGKLSYMFYVTRELGLVSKIYRGLLDKRSLLCNHVPDRSVEKPWICAVDSHAIGGGCQLSLVSDYVIAETRAYFTIPARTEGFIPGLANLRLSRFTGQRLANRMIYSNHKVFADSIEGRALVDEVVESDLMNNAIENAAKELCGMGIQGMASNRKAFRHGTEPIDVFRSYMATFCREQAKCMYDEEIICNIEKIWVNRYK